MIRISNLRLPHGGTAEQLKDAAARRLGLAPGDIAQLTLLRESLDARRRTDVHYNCTVAVAVPNEAALLAGATGADIAHWQPEHYRFPPVTRKPGDKPVVVGMGPAGLFAALFLARAGIPCVVLERGKPVEARVSDVARFWQDGTLDPQSNVQFGEGGAGTFSDGKLTTGIGDPRVTAVLETFVALGAPPDILYKQKPHIGTDVLRTVVRNMRAELIRLGCDLRFETTLRAVRVHDGRLAELTVEGGEGAYSLSGAAVILAPGHSARDTFSMLAAAGVPMEPKPFAVGVRIRHLQSAISRAQYGDLWERLPPADYKLSCHLPNGRSVFSFCVCPGGEIVNASSEPDRLTVNGMSYRARDGMFCNGGLLVGVSPADFDDGTPLGGMHFQAHWESAAFRAGGGGFRPPQQAVKPFLAAPGVLDSCLPDYVAASLRAALPVFEGRLRGFADPNALLVGVETRSSSPIRLLRGADFQSPVRNLYPCGEGAGWAGGITSAAVDGIRVAEAIAAG